MEKYIEQALLSILNQSFQDFEIIVVNDNSFDNTGEILKKVSSYDKRIKIINHFQNRGVYYSRIESIFHSKGKYILLMDPDDLYMNENLFQSLYDYNLNCNLDIIEFSVVHQIEGRRNFFLPKSHYKNHYHKFSKLIIYQPELSSLLYKNPFSNRYSFTICRNIWNKLIRKEIFLDAYKFIGNDYFNDFIIRSDDMLLNIMINHFANNYSNFFFPGYLYNLRSISMSRGEGDNQLKTIRTKNIISYFQLFYKYIKEFENARQSIYYEIRSMSKYIYYTKNLNLTEYKNNIKDLLNEIIDDYLADEYFKKYANKILLDLEEDD
jgi:glycosyltransferase involved in cell wall biosynthesis